MNGSYNYWLLDLSLENNTPENGDTITFNGVKYNNVLKTITLDSSLRQAGKKNIFFNYSSSAHDTVRSTNCDAPNAETFAVTRVLLFNQSELP